MLKLVAANLRTVATAGAAALSILGFGGEARAVDPEVVTINSSGTIYTPGAQLESAPAAAVANVILLMGGNGVLGIEGTGGFATTGNFLIRAANEFMLRGMNVMMGDVAPALPSGINYAGRLNGTHKAMIQTFINAANARWPGKPTWLVGTSNGSVSVVAALGDTTPVTGVAGGVYTSSVTIITNSAGQVDTANQAIFDADKVRITKPAYVVWHVKDGCAVSSPSGSQALLTAIPATTKSSLIVSGGHSVMTDLCGAFSWHGYAGVEADAIAPIVAYIRQVSGVSQPASPPAAAPAPGIAATPSVSAVPMPAAPSFSFANSAR